MMTSTYRFLLDGREYRFSAAHFTIFGPENTEELHGHNFYVKVSCSGHTLDNHDLLLDIEKPIEALRKVCALFNQKTLLPRDSPLVQIMRTHGVVEAQFHTKKWQFPEEGVVELPVRNISGESLAAYIWKQLEPVVGPRINKLGVGIEEDHGLSFWYENDVVPSEESS
ncbi:hypothetical protein F5884DRAFT_836905 [Xylogone sp. PMI_703]|nr:hypothetical protein F5884DRAFT_836905 [Xylogone sp. PMI_703]